MDASHAKHALALIMRSLRDGRVAYTNPGESDGPIKFAPIMHALVEGGVAWQDEHGNIGAATKNKWTIKYH